MIDVLHSLHGLSYKKANNTSSNSVRKNAVGAQVEFLLKFMERARVTLVSLAAVFSD